MHTTTANNTAPVVTSFHDEARALYDVLVLQPYTSQMPVHVKEKVASAIQAAEQRLKQLMQEHRGYWLGDQVTYADGFLASQQGPFLVESFNLKAGYSNFSVMLRVLTKDGKPGKKLVREYLDTKLIRITV